MHTKRQNALASLKRIDGAGIGGGIYCKKSGSDSSTSRQGGVESERSGSLPDIFAGVIHCIASTIAEFAFAYEGSCTASYAAAGRI